MTPAMPAYNTLLERMADAEHGPGWFAACAEAGQYLVPNRPLIEALAAVLGDLGPGPIVEVCAGDGALAAGLREHDKNVIATDSDPPTGASVEALDAEVALQVYQPRIVFGSFVPWDAGVNAAVLNASWVQHYIVLNAILDNRDSVQRLGDQADFHAHRLPEVTRWMLSRHDVWLGADAPPLTHGEAWLLSRMSLDAAG